MVWANPFWQIKSVIGKMPCRLFMKLAYLPQPGIVRLRLSGRHADQQFLQQTLDTETQKLKALISELIFGYDDQLLEKVVGDLLRDKMPVWLQPKVAPVVISHI